MSKLNRVWIFLEFYFFFLSLLSPFHSLLCVTFNPNRTNHSLQKFILQWKAFNSRHIQQRRERVRGEKVFFLSFLSTIIRICIKGGKIKRKKIWIVSGGVETFEKLYRKKLLLPTTTVTEERRRVRKEKGWKLPRERNYTDSKLLWKLVCKWKFENQRNGMETRMRKSTQKRWKTSKGKRWKKKKSSE